MSDQPIEQNIENKYATPNLFDPNNSLMQSAIRALTPEQREHYKKLGESMYGDLNFEDSKILNDYDAPIEESLAYITEGLKAGLHPSDLSFDELSVLKDIYKEHNVWLEKYGYTEKDLA
jgi:hypothetical protein